MAPIFLVAACQTFPCFQSRIDDFLDLSGIQEQCLKTVQE